MCDIQDKAQPVMREMRERGDCLMCAVCTGLRLWQRMLAGFHNDSARSQGAWMTRHWVMRRPWCVLRTPRYRGEGASRECMEVELEAHAITTARGDPEHRRALRLRLFNFILCTLTQFSQLFAHACEHCAVGMRSHMWTRATWQLQPACRSSVV